jgi:hypothetical protein
MVIELSAVKTRWVGSEKKCLAVMGVSGLLGDGFPDFQISFPDRWKWACHGGEIQGGPHVTEWSRETGRAHTLHFIVDWRNVYVFGGNFCGTTGIEPRMGENQFN